MNPLFIFLQSAASEVADTLQSAATEVADTLQSTVTEVADTTQTESVVKETIEYIVSTPASELIPELLTKALHFGLKVLAAVVIYLLGAWLIKLIKKFVQKMFERRNTDKAVSSFVTSLISITCTIVLIIITVGALGINTTSLAALLAAGGVAIGMSLSGTLQNFSNGIMILIFKPFKVGDFISAQGYMGTVSHMSIVSTTLTTIDNRHIILPNGALFSGTIDNYSTSELRRVDLTIGLTYGCNNDEVKKAFAEIIKGDPRILTAETGAPADPFYNIINLADSAVEYVVRVWCKGSDYWGVYFYLYETIYTELPKKGIEFPFPQMDVHMKND